MGDALSFGMTYHIREYMGTNGVVNFDSSGYELGEFAAFAWGYAMQGAQQFDAANSYNSQLKMEINKGLSRPDFYVTPSGETVPSTGYRYVSKEASYLGDMKESMKIPSNSKGATYMSFDKYEHPSPGKLQVPHDAAVRVSFDTLQIIDDIRIPYGKWNTTNYFEPLTKDFPKYGSGGATQAITNSEIYLYDIQHLK